MERNKDAMTVIAQDQYGRMTSVTTLDHQRSAGLFLKVNQPFKDLF